MIQSESLLGRWCPGLSQRELVLTIILTHLPVVSMFRTQTSNCINTTTFASRLPRPTPTAGLPVTWLSPGLKYYSAVRPLTRHRFPFHLAAYRGAYPGAIREPHEVSWGHAQIFRTVPPAHTLVRRVGKNAFAAIVPARPCPVFGRPVRHGVAPSTTARYFSSSPSDSTSRWTPCPPVVFRQYHQLRLCLGCLRRFRLRARLGVSLSVYPGQRGVTPAFGYSAPYPSASGTLTHQIWALPSTHYRLLRPCTPHRYSHAWGASPCVSPLASG